VLMAVRLCFGCVRDGGGSLSMRGGRDDGALATDLDHVAVLGAGDVTNEHEVREARHLAGERDDGQYRRESARRSISR
jgi:hypothetical protein